MDPYTDDLCFKHGYKRVVLVVAGAIMALLPTPARGEPLVGAGGGTDGGTTCGTYASVSAAGNACSSQGIAISGTGTASGSKGAASGIGTSYAGNGGIAVAGTGEAYSSNGAAVSLDNKAHDTGGSGVAASGTWQASGGAVNASPYALVINTGFLEVPATAEAAITPTTDTLDPVDTALKMATLAQVAPSVAWNMATGASDGLGESPMRSSTSNSNPCPDGTCRHVPMRYIHDQALIAQERWYYCGPAVLQMILASAGGAVPSQDYLAGNAGTRHPAKHNDPSAGTPSSNMHPVINHHRGSGDRFVLHTNKDAKALMDRVTAAAYTYRHGVILPTKPKGSLPGWGANGEKHFIVAHGYDHRSGGKVYIMDPYDKYRFGWTDNDQWRGNPFGSHEVRLAQLWAANEGNGALITW